ncbi:helix-turn-helix domain-containing protein [Amycolatopsis nalaikhensis]|uniref:Helix-turn-helix domain-containing protein n=1 Tax=Amycolatopsis nalaikhensis TaxID=715472 RepID=A0ABY8XQ80_9PSEU|nr:helix-turn-helix domain-containing protein [Amycolatopsis sp. 2-2]WIV57782.1 helix-turn-helix domain-containing protein [Amycolatopsis sp. 2-2]
MQTDDEALRRSDPIALEPPSHSQPTNSSTDEVGRLLYTPTAAAERLTVGESWLRRKAGQRLIPCTFVGKHLRFTEDDLRSIVAAGHRGPSNRDQTGRPGRRRRTRR